jgi:hypothetical protein
MASKEKKPLSMEKPESEMLRRFKAHPFLFLGSFFILVLVVVTFVAPSSLGLNSGRGSQDLTFGYYDKVPISYVPGNFFADRVYQYRQNSPDGEDNSYANFQQWRRSFEETAIHTAMLREMGKSGYSVPVKTVDREVAKLPRFQENGRFSSALYRQMDENSRLNLWRQVQDEIVRSRYLVDVFGLLNPSAEGEFIGSMGTLQRSFEMAVFNVDAYPDEEYEAYLSEHSELFGTIHLSMITVSSNEREAQKILTSIKDGETTFEDAARAHSKDNYADRGGDMGIKAVHELNIDIPEEAVREKALALGKGEFSDVMKTDAGWVFFRTEETVQDADDTDPAVLDKVRTYVRNYERGRMEDWAIEQANGFITQANEIGFEDAVSDRGFETRTFGPVPVNYGDFGLFTTLTSQQVSEISGAASDENFWRTAFSTPVNTPSQPVVRGSNVLVLFPTEETEAEEETVEGVTSLFEANLGSISEQALQRYILNSPKLEDKFYDMYFRLFMPQGN